MKKATIKDVSEKSGFSITTVSRVLNGNYPVKKETYKTIMKAVEELSFSRNSSARNLRTNKSNLIALVVADINNPYYSKIAKYIDVQLFEQGYSLLVCNTDESVEKENRILQVLQDKGVDAIIISSATKNIDLLRKIHELGIKIVLLDRNLGINDFPFIGSANFDSSKLLTDYLIRMGHKKILFVSGTENAVTSQERLSGFRSALLENDLPFIKESVIHGHYLQEDAHLLIRDVLTRNFVSKDPYTAIFSSNNLMTAGIIEAVNDLSLSIPKDISLVSFGELEMQEIISPKVTCIKQDIEQIAGKTLRTVLALLNETISKNESDLVTVDYLEIGNSVKKLLDRLD